MPAPTVLTETAQGYVLGPAETSTAAEVRIPVVGGGVTLVILGAIAVLCPWMPYVTGYGSSGNGWDSIDALESNDKFSAGPALTLVTGLIVLVTGGVVLMNQRSRNPISNKGVGVLLLVVGLVMLGVGGATFNALDELFTEAEIAVNQGVGLWLSCASGLATIVAGIVFLNKPSLTRGR